MQESQPRTTEVTSQLQEILENYISKCWDHLRNDHKDIVPATDNTMDDTSECKQRKYMKFEAFDTFLLHFPNFILFCNG